MEINIPTSWSDITINQYQALTQINPDDYKSKFRYSCQLVQVLCDIDDVSHFPLDIINEIILNFDFLAQEIPSDKKDVIEFRGRTFRWEASFNELTVGEMLSIEQIIDLEELTYNMSYDVVCAILLRENGDAFDAGKFTEYRELFGELPITDVYGTILFFLNGGKICTNPTATYSLKKMSMNTQMRSKWWRRVLERIQAHLRIING